MSTEPKKVGPSSRGGDGGTPVDLSKYENYDVIKTAVDVNPLSPHKTYLVDARTGIKTMYLPDVVPGDTNWYRIVLEQDGNHCRITTVSGSQEINIQGQLLTAVEIPTIDTSILVKANGVDGYDAILDARIYDRVVSVTGDLSLENGYESGGYYVGNLLDAQVAVITIQPPIIDHVGFYVGFALHSGENATLRVKTADDSFDQSITELEKSFTITVILDKDGIPQYDIKQDSRSSASNVAVNFLPTDNISVFNPAYGVLETASQPEEILTSIPIVSFDPNIPTSLGFWANDNKALIGDLDANNITADAQIKLTSAFNRTVKIKFKYYQYDFDTLTLNPIALSETSYSATIDSLVFEQRLVSGVLPAASWAKADLTSNNLLVIELLAVKDASGGDNPTIDFRSGGTNPSKTVINVPVSSVNHATLGGVVEARTGVPDGHIDNKLPLQLPELSTTERDLIIPNAGMELWNTTTGTKQIYDGVSWKTITLT